MARRFWRRRTILITALIVALSIGIVVAGVPYLPHSPPRHGTITTMQSEKVQGGNQSYPGYATFQLPGVSSNESFWVSVTVVGGTPATFCVIANSILLTWLTGPTHSWSSFPQNSCLFTPESTAGGTLTFLPPYSGTWDIVAFNSTPNEVTVNYNPAP